LRAFAAVGGRGCLSAVALAEAEESDRSGAPHGARSGGSLPFQDSLSLRSRRAPGWVVSWICFSLRMLTWV